MRTLAVLPVIVFVAVLESSQALADPLGAGPGAAYRLNEGSSYQEGCFPPCLCPILEQQPMRGTFRVAYAGQDPAGLHRYAIQDVNWVSPSMGARRITGSGKYTIGSPTAITLLQQRMELDLKVGDEPVQHFDSGWVPFSGSGGISITISLHGLFCWDRALVIVAGPVPASDFIPYALAPGATYQQGCFDPCDCVLEDQRPMVGGFALVPLEANPLFQDFAVVNVQWQVVSPASNLALPIRGFGLYRVGGEVAVQQQLMLDLWIGNDGPWHFDSGMVAGGAPFPAIDITVSRNGMVCFDTVLHVVAKPGPVQECGGIAGLPCDPGEFCKLPIGACCCDFMGVCMPIPTACPLYYDPVCGCDGVTYGNECEADAAGVTIDHRGPCAEVCGGIAGIPCPTEEFCKFPPGTCDIIDNQGVCVPFGGGACPTLWDPVCGCDGVTYPNECESDRVGVSIDHRGPCSQVCGGIAGLPCPEGSFCKFPPGTCDIVDNQGVCVPRGSGGCPRLWDPVCGCDGVTYANDCESDFAGVSIRHRGVCEPACHPAPDGSGCDLTACNSAIPEVQCIPAVLHIDWTTGAITTLACQCQDFNLCHIEFGNATPLPVGFCPNGGTCSVIATDSDHDGVADTFKAACGATGACCSDVGGSPLPVPMCSETTREACAGSGFYQGDGTTCEPPQACCIGAPAGAVGGYCVETSPACCVAFGGVPQGPNSTCDQNACLRVCGGIAGIPCHDGEFCKFPPGTCDIVDNQGVCMPIPTACPDVWQPVCGCDGVTYGNACEADMAGVAIDHPGSCATTDCVATRILLDPDLSYCPGQAKSVHITLTPPNNTDALALEDSPPAGWLVTNAISNGGVYDAVNHKVKWGPFFPPFPPEVSYVVIPPPGEDGRRCFSGSVAVNGGVRPICGDACVDRSCCPVMEADQPQPACAGCPVSGCDDCSNGACGDGRIALCEVIGYACSWLRGCNDDLSGVTRAAFIWRRGECHCWDTAIGNWVPTACPAPANGCCNAAAGGDGTTDGGAGVSGSARIEISRSAATSRGGKPPVWVVPLGIVPPAGTSAVAVEVKVGDGWEVANVSDGGVWNEAQRKIKWGPFFDDTARTLTFELRGAAPLPTRLGHAVPVKPTRRVSGTVSFDGVNRPIDVGFVR